MSAHADMRRSRLEFEAEADRVDRDCIRLQVAWERGLLTDAEFDEAAASILGADYTPPPR